MSDPLVSIETITPEAAAIMLKADDPNRRRRPRVIDAYARDMTAGQWHFTGEAIKFDEAGALLDGQHRLAAIVKSGTTQQMLVIRGVARTAQSRMDTGSKRTTSDALALLGEKNTVTLAAVARMILGGVKRGSVQPSNSEVFQVLEDDPTIRWAVNTCGGHLQSLKALVSITPLAYAYWRLHAVDSFACAEFFEKLKELSDLPGGSPILALHKRLLAHERVDMGYAYRVEAVALIFTAWNAWRKGEPRTIIKLAVGADGEVRIPNPI